MNISSQTGLMCLLGHPVKHSFSPIFQNAMLRENKQDHVYLAFDVTPDELEGSVLGLRTMKFTGANVTSPHKENVIKYIDEISEEAKRVGSVNTLSCKNGVVLGDNTDVYGFVKMLQEAGVDLNEMTSSAVLGTGGASKAVAVGLAMAGVKHIHIYSRSLEKGHKFVEELEGGGQMLVKPYEEIHKDCYDLVVNTTPMGMHPHEGKIIVNPKDLQGDNITLVDLIYNPVETKFLEAGRLLGYKTLNGLDMLIYQGMKSFEIWTGIVPNKATVVKAFRAHNII